MEFGLEYNGTIVPGGLGDSQHTDTALECQGLCWRMKGCQAFTWLKGNNNPCYLYHTVELAASRVNSQAVSGLASCEKKGSTVGLALVSLDVVQLCVFSEGWLPWQ